MRLISVDPGKQGALAVLDGIKLVSAHRTPMVGKEYDREKMYQILKHSIFKDKSDALIIETPIPMPFQSPSAGMVQGIGYGLWLGMAASLGLPLYPVAPATWKKAMGLVKARKKGAKGPTTAEKKKAAIAMAVRLCPGVPELRHDGCAEAYLLGLYAHRHLLGEALK